MLPDYLKDLSLDELAAWFRRLADAWPSLVSSLSQPLAGKFLRTWLDNREAYKKYVFDAPPHLRSLELKQVSAVLEYHRKVFLTQQRAKNGKWAGLLPRIQGLSGFQKWDMQGMLTLEYESLCEVGKGYFDITRIQEKGSHAERDILGALHGFQLKSKCKLTVSPVPKSPKVIVQFKEWWASATDDYHWNPNVGLTVFNPDYQSKASNAVRPQDKTLFVYHSNQRRLENAKMAAPFKVVIKQWQVNDARISDPEIIPDLNRPLR